ncbi:MAG: iron-sulfur cluster assembly accessory protein [Deltaproteobacteria bacterium]|nr:iron-sulfur cluster assembly accessory protein [Deltaproteobacteria bacterium]
MALDVIQEAPKPSAPSGTIEITDKAAVAISKYLKANDAPEGAGLRIGLRGGGCSGLSYHLDVEANPRPTDHVIQTSAGPSVYVDPKSLIYLQGSVLDYVTGLMESGFKFLNPKAGKACGCGESFSPL